MFRQEVVEYQNRRDLGSLRAATAASYRTIGLLSITLVLAIIIFLIFAQVARKSRAPGLIVPEFGSIQVSSSTVGVISKRFHLEGERVRKGEPLFVVSTERTGSDGESTVLISRAQEEQGRALNDERRTREALAELKTEGIRRRLYSLRRELAHASTELAIGLERISYGVKTAERNKALAASGFVSEVQVQSSMEALLDIKERRKVSERNEELLQKELSDTLAEEKDVTAQLRVDLAQLDHGLAVLAQEKTQNIVSREIVVKAPDAGTLSAETAKVGTVTQVGQTLTTLLLEQKDSHETYAAELYAPSHVMGLIRQGQPVLIRIASFPFQKFGLVEGKVDFLGRSPINPADLPPGQSQALLVANGTTEPLYKIGVQLSFDDSSITEQDLRAGMSIEADVLQEKKSLVEWLFDPLIGISRRRVVTLH